MPSVTITYTAAEGNRIADACGDLLNLGRAATAAESKQVLMDYLKQLVLSREKRVALAALPDTPFVPT